MPKSTASLALPFVRSHTIIQIEDSNTTIPSYPHIALQPSAVSDFLRASVAVPRLNDLHDHLWLAGRPAHIRPLHVQRLLQRRLVISEDPCMHLVWRGDTMYIKPLPAALLSCEFWERFLCAEEGGESESCAEYHAAACGLLASYAELVKHPSDFRFAVSEGLLPEEVSWREWCLLAHDVRLAVASPEYKPEPRWEYGELRLGRLNLIYKATLRGYSYYYVYTEYSEYLGKNFRLLLLAFAYCSVTLAAMQVIVSSSNSPGWLLNASFWFAALAASFVFTVTCIGGGLLAYLFTYHSVATLKALRKAKPPKQLA